MNRYNSKRFPNDPDRLPPARRRRARRLLTPLDADERAAFLDEIAHRTYPSFDFFLFSLLAGAIFAPNPGAGSDCSATYGPCCRGCPGNGNRFDQIFRSQLGGDCVRKRAGFWGWISGRVRRADLVTVRTDPGTPSCAAFLDEFSGSGAWSRTDDRFAGSL